MSSEEVPTVEQLNSLKLKELKERCKSHGLTVTGSKKDLVERLRNYLIKRADDESLLLSDDALIDDEVSGAAANASDEDVDEDIKTSTQSSHQNQSPSSEKAENQPEPANDIEGVKSTPAEAHGQSESNKEKEIASPTPAAPVSQSEPAAETKNIDAIEIDSETADRASQPDEAEAPQQPLQGVLRAPMKAAGLAELTEDERRKLRAKRFGVEPAAASSSDTTHPEIESRKRARAQRFGNAADYASPKPVGARGSRQTIGASLAPGDVEKMRKRAERFGVVTSPALLNESAETKPDANEEESEEVAAKKRARAARFGAAPSADPAAAGDSEPTEEAT